MADGIRDDADPTVVKAAMDAWDQFGLNYKADGFLEGGIVLLTQAADALHQVAMMMFEDNAASPDALRLAQEATEIARGGCLLADIDPRTKPSAGVVERLTDEDGQMFFRWRPLKDDERR